MDVVSGSEKRVCKRCLIREFDQKTYEQELVYFIERLGADLRTADSEYEKRLEICKGCDRLEMGTCKACGCYVEIRAAARTGNCPRKKW